MKDILIAHPEIKKIQIEGHTDNRGNAAWNKKLSGARATAVVTWLTRHGIAKTRMGSAGYGQERPLDSNDSDAGRAAVGGRRHGCRDAARGVHHFDHPHVRIG